MSSAADGVEVTREGVTVAKGYEAGAFPVPAVHFELVSEREEPTTVHLTDRVPESLPMDAIGFHPEYHSDDWTAYEDHRVEFVRELAPGETVETVYGIRLDEEPDAEAFLEIEPTVRLQGGDGADEGDETGDAGGVQAVDDVAAPDRNDVVKEMIRGDREGVPGLDEAGTGSTAGEDDASQSEEDRDSEDDQPTIELDLDAARERIDGEESTADRAVTDDETVVTHDGVGTGDDASDDRSRDGHDGADRETNRGDEERSESPEATSFEGDRDADTDDAGDSSSTGVTATEVGESIDPELTVAALAAACRSDVVDDADLETIRTTLVGDSPDTASRAKVDHLQSRVEEVAAYTGALEEFLGENGTAEELADDLRAEIDAVESRIDDLEDRLETTAAEVESVRSTTDETADAVDSIGADLDDVADTVDALDGAMDDLADDVEDVRADVTDLREWRDQLGSMFTEE